MTDLADPSPTPGDEHGHGHWHGPTASRRRVLAAIAALVVLVVLGLLMTHSPRWHAGELAIDQAAIDGAPVWATAVSRVIAVVFGPAGTSVIVVVIAALALALRRRWRAATTALALTVVPWLATEALKAVVRRPRPATHGVAPISTPWTWAYPSGHAAAATAVVIGVLWLAAPVLRRQPVLRRVAVAVGVVIVLAVATSRVVLAVHYPTDVVAGPLCAAAFAVLVDEAQRRIRRTSTRR